MLLYTYISDADIAPRGTLVDFASGTNQPQHAKTVTNVILEADNVSKNILSDPKLLGARFTWRFDKIEGFCQQGFTDRMSVWFPDDKHALVT